VAELRSLLEWWARDNLARLGACLSGWALENVGEASGLRTAPPEEWGRAPTRLKAGPAD